MTPPSTARRLTTLQSREAPLASATAQQQVLRALPLAHGFEDALGGAGLWPLRATGIETLQINVGKQCNQSCRHCHVDAGPDRTEAMSRETMDACLAVLAEGDIATVDITGGAPEMNPHFRYLVERSHALGKHVLDRCNLTIMETGPHRDLPDFFAQHRVEVVASLPHYRSLSTDRQRGDGVFERSIAAMRRLNAAGYAQPGTGLRLVLVTNPVGAFLPASQASIEAEWKREMQRLYSVQFDALYCITNMPISRYLDWLQMSENLEPYMQKLLASFNPAAAAGVMCRNTLSVGWDGRLFDCDFNQMLEMPVESGAPQTIAEFSRAPLAGRQVRVGPHCFGCTAGAGSSCGGEVATNG